MEYRVKVKGQDELLAKLREAPAAIGPILQRALLAGQAVLAKHTTRDTVPWRTGFLTQSFRARMEALRLTWYPTASYAPYVELGHSQQVGRYVPAIGARLVQPFVKGNRFMERIVRSAQGEIDDTFERAGQLIAEALSTGT